MLRTTLASSRVLRVCVLGLATITTAVIFTTDTADARRHKSRHHVRHVAKPSYSPAFSSIIVDANSGATLTANNPDAIRLPASLTKIMTLYLLFERLEAGKMKLDSEMEVSEHASEQAPTKLGLRPGQTIKVEDAIKGLVTRSANDASVVIAEAIAGDEDDFAKLMTRKARALGMSKTVYRNANGLPNDRAGHHRARSGDARPRDPGTLPALLSLLRDLDLRLSRPCDPQSQPPARQCRGRRRHQDRLHPRLRLQSRDLDAPRQPPSGRRGARRPQRRFARCHHAQPAGRKSRKGRHQPHRCRDHRARRFGSQCRSRRSRSRRAADADGSGPGRNSGRLRSIGAGRSAGDAFDRQAVRARRRHRGCAAAASQDRGRAAASQDRTRTADIRRYSNPAACRDPRLVRTDEAGPGQDRSGQGRTDQAGLGRSGSAGHTDHPCDRAARGSAGDIRRRGGQS